MGSSILPKGQPPVRLLAAKFNTDLHGMTLVKLALDTRGIYVTHKSTAMRTFMAEFGNSADVSVVEELHRTWDNWHNESIDFSRARSLADRLVVCANQVAETFTQLMPTFGQAYSISRT